MSSQATIFVICFMLYCVYSQESCRNQDDCGGGGMRCIIEDQNDIAFACENSMTSRIMVFCRCRLGCLKCDGSLLNATSRFIPMQPEFTRVGCGNNLCTCVNALDNEILCQRCPCRRIDWIGHCESP